MGSFREPHKSEITFVLTKDLKLQSTGMTLLLWMFLRCKSSCCNSCVMNLTQTGRFFFSDFRPADFLYLM